MYDDGGMVIEDGSVTVYAPTTASQPREDGGEIDVWRSADGDGPWQRGEPLTAGSDLSHNLQYPCERCLPFVGLDRTGFSSIRAIVMNLLTFMSRVKIK